MGSAVDSTWVDPQTRAPIRRTIHQGTARRPFWRPRSRRGVVDAGTLRRRWMPKAYWNGTLLAESDDTIVLEGRHYFPTDAVRRDLLQESQTRTRCPRKGEARFFHITVDGRLNADAAWTYRNPRPAARQVKGRVAFWHGVEVE